MLARPAVGGPPLPPPRSGPRRVWGSGERRRKGLQGLLVGGGWGALTEDEQHVPGARRAQAAEDQDQQQQPADRPSAVHGGSSRPARGHLCAGPAPPRSRALQVPPPGSHVRARPRPTSSSLPLPLRFLRTRLRRQPETPSCGAR